MLEGGIHPVADRYGYTFEKLEAEFQCCSQGKVVGGPLSSPKITFTQTLAHFADYYRNMKSQL